MYVCVCCQTCLRSDPLERFVALLVHIEPVLATLSAPLVWPGAGVVAGGGGGGGVRVSWSLSSPLPPTEAQKGHSILPFYANFHPSIFPSFYPSILPYCGTSVICFHLRMRSIVYVNLPCWVLECAVMDRSAFAGDNNSAESLSSSSATGPTDRVFAGSSSSSSSSAAGATNQG